MPVSSRMFPILSPLPPLHPFCSNVILMRFVSSSFYPWSRAVVGIDNISVFVLRFPILRWVSPLLFICILQGIAAGIGTSNFLRAAFIVSSIVWHCRALVSRWPIFVLLSFSLHRTKTSTYLAIHNQYEKLSVSSSLPGLCVSFWWPFVQQNESCESCPCIR